MEILGVCSRYLGMLWVGKVLVIVHDDLRTTSVRLHKLFILRKQV